MARLTDEAYLTSLTLGVLRDCPALTIHAWHPPSSKAYFGPLIPIPRKMGRDKTRERYHLDGIVQCGSCLLLVELKGAASGLASDWAKIQELTNEYSLDELVAIMLPRVHEPNTLKAVDSLHACFGFRVEDAELDLPITLFKPGTDSRLVIRSSPSTPVELLRVMHACPEDVIKLL